MKTVNVTVFNQYITLGADIVIANMKPLKTMEAVNPGGIKAEEMKNAIEMLFHGITNTFIV